MPEPSPPTLVRAIGRWSLAALTVNCIIGSGVFGLPSVIAGQLGHASPWAWLLAAIATAFVMACFAEVSSRFDASGGVYLYARYTFGRTTGIAIAWLGWLARITAAAANANLFVLYLGEFWPAANSGMLRIAVLTAIMAVLTAVNYFGVRRGTKQSDLFTAAKLITLGGFIVVGLLFVALRHMPLAVSTPHGPLKLWLHPILLLIFAYGGYETALMPGGEARDPRRDYPFALFVALITCTVVYTLTQLVVISLLPNAAASDRPIAAVAQIILGPTGATLVSIGVLVSCYGYLSANILGFPRILFAMAERGDLPSVFARVHPRFRTPHIAIGIFAILLYGFSIAKGFQWNLFVSAMARLIYYASVALALPVLRHRIDAPEARFQIPFGWFFSLLTIGTSLLLFPKLDRASLMVLGVLTLCIVGNTVWASRNAKTSAGET
jgi:basic amino acid/polyamine antiporter, APA family